MPVLDRRRDEGQFCRHSYQKMREILNYFFFDFVNIKHKQDCLLKKGCRVVMLNYKIVMEDSGRTYSLEKFYRFASQHWVQTWGCHHKCYHHHIIHLFICSNSNRYIGRNEANEWIYKSLLTAFLYFIVKYFCKWFFAVNAFLYLFFKLALYLK